MRRVCAEQISAAGFAGFGDVMTAGTGVARADFTAQIVNLRPAARANLAIVRPPLVRFPFGVAEMERHPASSQAFLPLGGTRYLVVVAPDRDNAPDIAAARAFIVPPTTAINYHVGTWHVGMAVLDPDGSLALLVHEDGSPGDCEIRAVARFVVDAPPAA